MSVAEHNRPDIVFGAAHMTDQAVPAPHALPVGASMSTVSGLAGLMELEPQWRALEQVSPASSVFQTFDWLTCWAKIYANGPQSPGLCIITGHQDGQLVFAWPLMKVRVGPLTVLRWMAEPLSQYGDILIASGQCPKVWMEQALDLVLSLRGIDAIRLRHVRADATVAPVLQMRFRDTGMTELAPWLDLTQFADEAAYDARYSSSQRKRRKKIRKSLEDDIGPVQFDMLGAGPDADRAITEAIAEKCQWLDERGRQNRALCETQTADFLKLLSRASGGSTQLVTSRLAAGGRAISWEIGLRFRGTHFGFVTSHVTALTDYSPGRLHMDLSQRLALKNGMKAFDLMVPNDAHKESWSSAKVETRDYHLPVSALGRLYGIGYLETARPLLRKAYYGMPPRLLRLLKPITGH